MKVTDQNARRAYTALRELLGKREANTPNDTGGWYLDRNFTFGGYVICEVRDSSGGVSMPLMATRLRTEAFVQACRMASEAVHIARAAAHAALQGKFYPADRVIRRDGRG